jgi:hypothetical protein
MPKDAKGHGSNPRGTHSTGVESAVQSLIRLHPGLVNTIRQNPGGFSVKPGSGKAPTKGYMVSVPGRTKMLQAADLAGPRAGQIISAYAQANADALKHPGAHIGGWTDSATGITHLDVSQNIRSRKQAEVEGRKRNQIAIWDVKHMREINTGGTGDKH